MRAAGGVLRVLRLLDHDAVLVGDPVERVEVAERVGDRGGAEHDRQRVGVALLVEQLQAGGQRALRGLQRVAGDAQPLAGSRELALSPRPSGSAARRVACARARGASRASRAPARPRASERPGRRSAASAREQWSPSPRRRSPPGPVRREQAGLRGRPANSGACASPPARRGTVPHEFVPIRAQCGIWPFWVKEAVCGRPRTLLGCRACDVPAPLSRAPVEPHQAPPPLDKT